MRCLNSDAGGRVHKPLRMVSGRRLSLLLLLAVVQLVGTSAWAGIVEVRLEGLEGELLENAQALLGIYQEQDEKDLSKLRMMALHRRAPQQIRDALAPYGHYRVQVQDSLEEPSGEGGKWIATYRVDPGEAIKIGTVDYRVEGAGASDPGIPKVFPMKVGDVLLHADYEKAKSSIRSAGSKLGYLDFQLTRHQVLIDPTAYQALVVFHVDTGPKFYLGKVSFTQDLLADEYLQRFVQFEVGDPYDPNELLQLQGALLGMEYYDKVEIDPKKDQAGEDKVVPIEVIGHRNKANKFRFGLGVATDVGVRASMDWRRRYVTRWGHKFKTLIELSQIRQKLEAEYRVPFRDPLREYFLIKPRYEHYDTDERQGDTTTLQFAYSTMTKRGWRRTAGIDYRYENYTVTADDTGNVQELVPNISWAKTVADDPIFTRRGYRVKFTIQGAVEGIVSPASYLQALLRFKWVQGFAEDYRVLFRTDLGTTWASAVTDLPASRRFYAGGDNSIRGWGLDVLGPNDQNDEVVGGRHLAVGSLELERRMWKDLSGAVFTDFGNAFDPDYDVEVRYSAGAGLRYKTPIGQVRFDMAYAINKDDPGFRLHFILGPDL